MTLSEHQENQRLLWVDRTPSKFSDEEAWIAFKNDSTLAFKHLYDVYVDSLYSYGRKLAPSNESVEDIIQDMFIDLWNSRHRLGKVTNVKAYLFISFRRRLFHLLKKQNKYPAQIKLSEIQDVQDYPDSDQESSDEKVAFVMMNLPERQREAIILRFQSGLSCPEIAKVLNINQQSVYNLIHKGIKALRANILTLLLAPFWFLFGY